MKVVGVATSDSRAYYSILSRLKETNLRFVSLTPSQATDEVPEPIITTKSELGLFSVVSIPIEELDENPLIMEGQILSKTLSENKQTILVGVDPGMRIGAVVFYGGTGLGSFTVNSIESLLWKVVSVVHNIPHTGAVIKVGDGAPKLSRRIVRALVEQLPEARVEVVDERGTTIGKLRSKGLTKDQRAAASIAFRRGTDLKDRSGARSSSPYARYPGA
ncbi:MAG: hypothetical protein ABSF83_00130 [Nitrososphaerales archaeon]|jgi:hypothetical protein